MYIPNAYRQDDAEQLIAFMRAHSFVTLVSSVDGLPVASHIPVIVSQRSRADQRNVAHALLQSADPAITGVGAAMQRNLEVSE